MASGYNSPVSSFIASALRRASMPTLASNATNITGVSSPLAAAGQQQQQVLQGNAVFDELVCSSAAVPDISWPNVAVSVLQLNALEWQQQQKQKQQPTQQIHTNFNFINSNNSNKRPLSAIEDNKDELLKNQLLSDPLALLDFVKFSSTPFATVSDSQLNQAQVQKNKRRRTSDIQPKPQQETKEAQQEPLREGLVDSKKSNSKPTKYQCSRCHKYFTRPSSLTTHVYTHTGEKPHECPVAGCTKRFSVLSNMRRHMKLHQDPVVPRSRRPSQYDQYYMSYPYPIIHHGQPLPHQYQQYQQYQYPPYMVPAIDGNCLPLMQHMTPGIFAPQLASGMQDSFPLSVPGMAVSLSPVCAASVAAAAAANMNRRFSTPAFSTLYPDMTPSATPGSVSESGNSAVLAGDMPYMPVNGVSVDSAAFAGQTAQPPTQ